MRDYYFTEDDGTVMPVSAMSDDAINDVLARGPEIMCSETPVSGIIERLRIERTIRELGLQEVA